MPKRKEGDSNMMRKNEEKKEKDRQRRWKKEKKEDLKFWKFMLAVTARGIKEIWRE